MTDSLRDQLLNLGFKPAPAPERKPGGKPPHAKSVAGQGKPGGTRGERRDGAASRGPRKPGAHGGSAEMDLGKAFALRAQKEKQERIEAEQRRQEEARQRREARARLEALLQDKGLNDPAAEIARHFEYGGKIKRIYVNEAQLKALNAGELGVVQLNGRYLLVEAAVLAEAEAVFPAALALKVDPSAPAGDDPYADPRYQVPDDLVW
ncbi:DUF2058 family protein [Pseudoxanthomonas kaohsiungensis]|uniref:DUF2058 family protein n=1 Tax=Pseudoxanthomonas kaohsiungensis TaxID=283923 RepID=A0ABW3LXV9_9GAMM|nr:DUF2058 family protein [Pseudoxanthomonas kaohsiungensis]KAF1702420.1 nucleoprotein/polynucleotide-associated enzyme [Pseudoxanthomonas kaohsiungensis]